MHSRQHHTPTHPPHWIASFWLIYQANGSNSKPMAPTSTESPAHPGRESPHMSPPGPDSNPLQGYLAYKKPHHPRTLCTVGLCLGSWWGLRGWTFSYGGGTPVPLRLRLNHPDPGKVFFVHLLATNLAAQMLLTSFIKAFVLQNS